MSEQRTKTLDEKRHVSQKLSDLIRYISFGIIAACYSLFTSETKIILEILARYKFHLSVATEFAILSIAIDYLQFLFAYLSTNKALRNQNNLYDKSSICYQWRGYCFHLKQGTTLIAIGFFLYVGFRAI
jgi:hypothetical protein